MSNHLASVVALLLALAPLTAEAQEKRLPFLAVLELRVENKVVPLDTASTLANLVRSRVVRAADGAFKLISREQVFEILSKANKSAAQCTAECEVQTAREIGADYVLTGSISPLGDLAVLVLDVKTAKDGVTVASASAKAPAKSLHEKLDAAVDELVAELKPKLGGAPAAKKTEEAAPTQAFGGSKRETAKEIETDELEEIVVKFTSTPPASVHLGEKMLCKQTPCQKSVPLGKQSVTMSAEDYVMRSEPLTIEKKTKEISWQLQPDFGTLNVTCGGQTVNVKVDGATVACPVQAQHLRPGKHKVLLDSPCHLGVEETFEVKRGEAKTLALQVNPRIGVVTVKAKDDGGDDLTGTAWLDGKQIGEVPGSFKVPVCGKQLEVRSDGHVNWTGELGVKEGEKRVVLAEMHRLTMKAPKSALAAKSPGKGKLAEPLAEAPASPFRDNGDGTVDDSASRLTWQRAVDLNRFKYGWQSAELSCQQLALAGHGWRLPTKEELLSLVSKRRAPPTIDVVAFPKTPSDGIFWTSSSVRNGELRAWGVHFGTGNESLVFVSNSYGENYGYVRCVRERVDRFRPSPEGDIVVDRETGLTWQRHVVSPPTARMPDAESYCTQLTLAGGRWRLPQAAELLTLVEKQRAGPKIDQATFPDTPATWFWTARPPQAFEMWRDWPLFVHFGHGLTGGPGIPQEGATIRCVR